MSPPAGTATINTRVSFPRRGAPWRMAMVALAVLGLAACGAPPDEVAEEEQAITLPTPEGIAMEALKRVGEALLSSIINDALGDPAGEVGRRFDAIDFQLKQIEDKVVELTGIVRRSEVAGVKRDVDRDRANLIRTPLFQVQMFPARAAEYEDKALGAAFTYAADSFYWFTGPTSENPSRYDHRMAAPTFIEAVQSWLLFRKIAGHPLDAATRVQLDQFANVLQNRVDLIRGNVTCRRIEQPIYKKVGNERRNVGCRISYPCNDGIAESSFLNRPTHTGGSCQGGTFFLSAEADNLRRQYGGPDMESIVQQWRALVNS